MTPSALQELEHAILYGDCHLTTSILDAEPGLLDARFPENLNLTPLMWACRNRRESIVAKLLGRGADPSLSNRLEAGGDGGNTALWFTGQGTGAGTTGIASRLLAAGADVNVRCEHGQTPLHIAAAWCHLDLVQQFLDHGADQSIGDESGQSPLAMLRHYLARFTQESSLGPDQRHFVERAPRVIAFLGAAARHPAPAMAMMRPASGE